MARLRGFLSAEEVITLIKKLFTWNPLREVAFYE